MKTLQQTDPTFSQLKRFPMFQTLEWLFISAKSLKKNWKDVTEGHLK